MARWAFGAAMAFGWALLSADAAAADEAEIDVARGRVALELEQYAVARDRAVEALKAEPWLGAAHELYVDATARAGLGSRGLFELAAFEVQTPPWHGTQQVLVEAVAGGDWKAVRDATEQVLASFPNEPALLLPLWDTASPKVVKLRQRLLDALAHPDALAAADVATLYGVRELVVAANDPVSRAVVGQALADRGEAAPAPRAPLDRMGRTELALEISKEPVPALPWGYPSELVDVVGRLEATLAKARKFRQIALAWQEVQRSTDDPTAWTHEASAWLLDGELDRANAAAEAAVWRASRPRNTDIAALNTERERADLAAALVVRSQVAEARGDVVAALGDYGAAVVLAERTLDDKLGERLEDASRAAARTVSATYAGSVPATVALAAAVKATADAPKARAILTDARFLATLGTRGGHTIAEAPDAYAEVFSQAFAAEADVEAQAGRLDAARAAAVIATVLAGKSRPFWWATRAELHDRNGEYDAAFAAWSIARGLGVRELDANLQRTYVGVSDWVVAANNLGGPPPEVAASRAPVATTHAPARPRPRTDRPPSAPRLGQPFPPFSIDTGYGKLTNTALKGRIAVLTFWDARCEECLQMLPEFGGLARRLRREGRDAMVVGVSVDDDAASFERVYAEGQRWAELVWAPGLRVPFAVDALPTTWVIDPSGVARYFVDHWLSVDELETFVRDLD